MEEETRGEDWRDAFLKGVPLEMIKVEKDGKGVSVHIKSKEEIERRGERRRNGRKHAGDHAESGPGWWE